MCRNMILTTVTTALLLPAASLQAVTVDSSGEAGGPTPAQLADSIADPASDYFIVADSVNTKINSGNNPDSNPRAMGKFSSGITAKGTLLPALNQNVAGDAQYEGGLGINLGICLCRGSAPITTRR